MTDVIYPDKPEKNQMTTRRQYFCFHDFMLVYSIILFVLVSGFMFVYISYYGSHKKVSCMCLCMYKSD